MWSARDALLAPADGEALAAAIADSRLVVYADTRPSRPVIKPIRQAGVLRPATANRAVMPVRRWGSAVWR